MSRDERQPHRDQVEPVIDPGREDVHAVDAALSSALVGGPPPARLAARIVERLGETGWTLLRLPQPTDVIVASDGSRIADFGPVTVRITSGGEATITHEGEFYGPALELPLCSYAATRWALDQAQHYRT